MSISTTYLPSGVESKWYKIWEEGGYFKPHSGKRGSYCIIMPPPNVTGRLHAGHALDITTQDALVRFKRMKGFETLFLPGMDHAGIATQNVVEKLVYEKEKKTRDQFSREEFIKKIWAWKEEYGDIIALQQRSMGAGPDWDYSLFTMDAEANEAVRKVFVHLYNEGLIYQSDYIVNWDTELKSAISDAEVKYTNVGGLFYHIRYRIQDSDDFIEIATTRPETLLGDTAVSVHPDDHRYQHLVGKTAIVPICNRPVPIIADDYVDREKGTGCLKVTPGHDFNDFEIGQRHNLPVINILNEDGTLNEHGLQFKGMTVEEARKNIVKRLQEEGLFVCNTPLVHRVGHGDRTGVVIEPMVSRQWFLNVQQMAKVAVEKVRDGSVKFFPKSWESTYFSWLKDPKNWCISRQLWWGHRIPIFYCGDCGHKWADEKDPAACVQCQSVAIKQDPDVLDTWFSSSLWPFSTLGWPDKQRMAKKKFDTFFPSSCLVTGYDIIFFWVARMMMMSLKFFNEVPFRHIYIHALVRDKLGRKMSKSLGNGIDPLEMVEQYGADAFRFTLASGAGHNRELNLDPERIEGYRNFINKIWNAFRFIHPSLKYAPKRLPPLSDLSHHEKWILAELNETTKVMNNKIEEYRFDEACSAIYSFVYDKFCSLFIEISKPILNSQDDKAKGQRAAVLRYAFQEIVTLLHPFAPFVTEEMWDTLKNTDDDLVIVRPYPEYRNDLVFDEDRPKMNKFIDIVTSIRHLRSSVEIKPRQEVKVFLFTDEQKLAAYLVDNKDNFYQLARANELVIKKKSAPRPAKCVFSVTSHTDIFLPLEGVVDIEDQLKKIERQRQKTLKELDKCKSKLTNKKFVENARPEVVADVRYKEKKLIQKMESLDKNLKLFQSS